jgi:MFS family permease
MTPPLHLEADQEASSQSQRSEPLIDSRENDWITCFRKWLRESAWHGMGLFGESYLLFSIGTLRPVWETLFPDCFVELTECSPHLVHSLSYSVVMGVITGMLVVGSAANIIGRRNGSIATAVLMSGGATGLSLASVLATNHPQTLLRWMSLFLFIFGVGVGGEYPLSASSASERAMGEMKASMKLELAIDNRTDGLLIIDEDEPIQEHKQQETRGRQIQLVFCMQGMGIFFNSVIMTALLIITGQTTADYNFSYLLGIWRITYLIGAAILLYVLFSRFQYLSESTVWQDDKRRREALARNQISRVPPQAQHKLVDYMPAIPLTKSGISMVSEVSSLSAPTVVLEDRNIKEVPSTDPEDDIQANTMLLLLRNYGVRLLGVSTSWLLWDGTFCYTHAKLDCCC